MGGVSAHVAFKEILIPILDKALVFDYTAKDWVIPAGFIHLPLESECPTERAVVTLCEALEIVAADCIRPANQNE